MLMLRVKYALDFIAAFFGLIILSPVLVLLALLVYLNLGYPVIFSQQRPGHKGRIFSIYKFRTMKDIRDENGNLLHDSERMTRLGYLLRDTSLDEIPELFNVLKGDMSLVGPRPLLVRYLAKYTPEQARRHDIRPGITGWAQINGRNVIKHEQQFELDVWYVDNWSLLLDLKILLKTVSKVLKRADVKAKGAVAMPENIHTKE